jgi:hypothetical protein
MLMICVQPVPSPAKLRAEKEMAGNAISLYSLLEREASNHVPKRSASIAISGAAPDSMAAAWARVRGRMRAK